MTHDPEAQCFDTLDPEFCADPYPRYARMRDRHPVFWSEVERAWVVTRHAGVSECLGDALLSNARVAALFERVAQACSARLPEILKLFEVATFFQDPPQHGPQRRFLSHSLAPEGGMTACSGAVEQIADRLMARLYADGGGDLIGQFADPLPPLFMGWLYGLSDDDTFRVVELLHGVPTLLVDRARPLRFYMAAEPRLAQVHDFFRELIQLRRRRPGLDTISRMVELNRTLERPRNDHALAAMATFLFLAGFETTAALIGNGTHLLLGHSPQAARLRQDPAAMDQAVQEVLRMEPPVQQTTRYANHTSVVAGQAVEAGQRLVLLLAAANRDPLVYSRPDEFDPFRHGPGPLSLGGGAHGCLGAGIAKLETRVALAKVLGLPNPVLATDESRCWRDSQNLRRLEALWVRIG